LVTGVLFFCLATLVSASQPAVGVASVPPAVCSMPTVGAETAADTVASTPVGLAYGSLIDSTFAQVISAPLLTAALLVASVNVGSTTSATIAKPATGAFGSIARHWIFPAAPMRQRTRDDASNASREQPTDAKHTQQWVA